MHNSKPHRPGSKNNAANQAKAIDPNHYPFIKFPADSPVQPGDRVEWMDEDERLLTGSVLEEGAYLLQNVLYVRVDFEECIDAVVATSLTKVFDYEALDAETRIVVQQKTGEIKTLMRRAAQDILDIGVKLIEVKTKLEHGGFGKWLDAEFNWDVRQAQRMMSVANAFKNDNLSDLKFGPSALYLLSAPSTPEEARAEAIARAEAGEVVTHAVAKAIVTALRPPVTPAPEPSPTAKAYQQANQVLPPATRPPAVTYGKQEDDYQDDVPSTDADEPDWLEDPLEGKSAIEDSSLKIGDSVTSNSGDTVGLIQQLNPQMGALVKFPNSIPHWLKLDTLTKVNPEAEDEEDDEPAVEPVEFGIGDYVETTFGRKDGCIMNVDDTRADGKTVFAKFPGGSARWFEPEDLVLIKRNEKTIDGFFDEITNPSPVTEAERTRRAASRAQSAQRQAAKAEMPENWLQESKWRLIEGDLLEQSGDIADESIDIIITDPPYGVAYLDLYTKLSVLAARVLKPGGSLICMTGQICLPDVMRELGQYLNYHWTLTYLTQGGQSPQIWPRKINTFWKPLLWYVKGEYSGDWMGDVVKNPAIGDDKAFHEWGQSLGGFADIVNRFTYPNDLILDPFMGAGTTGIAALQSYRRFIGIELDKDVFFTAAKRLNDFSNGQVSEANHG